jgi:hypothetical protein
MSSPRANRNDDDDSNHHTDSLLYEEANRARKIAKAAAEGTMDQIVAEFFRNVDAEEPAEDDSMLQWDSNHPGERPINLDADAKVIARKLAADALRKAGYPEDICKFCGEEAGSGTQRIRVGDIIIRQDVLDGSKLAERVMTDFSSVHLTDKVRTLNSVGPRTRHLGGAIVAANALSISWANHSQYLGERHWYPRPEGVVYLDGHRWGQPERRVRGLSYNRHEGTVAAVAAKPEKKRLLDQILAGLGIEPETVVTVGGTPLVASLITGAISMIVEPNPVTLHDSALLIPFQLLGGCITDTDGVPLNYLKLYEQNAHIMDPKHTPIPGYIAWANTENFTVASPPLRMAR